jgi:signal transduction histidine kinase
MVGGVAALVLVPLRPEHQRHLAPLLAVFLLCKAVTLVVLGRWTTRARAILLGTVAADLVFVFLLVWFTGGAESHFYLLFYPLVALDAYYFGPRLGVLVAIAAWALLGLANWLVPPVAPWAHLASRAALLGLLALALGHVAARERMTRARVEQLAEEVRAASARLVQAERLAAVGRLSARVAHEVRNPLGAITLNVDMLADIVRECPGPAMGEAQELVRGIQRELRSLAALTDEYRVAGRLPRPKLEEDSVNELVTEVVGFTSPVAERQGVQLTLELDPRLRSFTFDRDLLKHAVRNLLKNSLEAVPRGGRIGVRTGCEGDAVVIAVSDDGPGITPEVAARLSEPFFTTKLQGTGLGLSVAREVAREHGGELTWKSKPGAGAEFTLRLGRKDAMHG